LRCNWCAFSIVNPLYFFGKIFLRSSLHSDGPRKARLACYMM
jgi:hypothetical protein